MKTQLLSIAIGLISFGSFADLLTCKSTDGKYEINANLDLKNSKVTEMNYSCKGASYKTFNNLGLKMSNKGMDYEIAFNNGDYFYLELERTSAINQLKGVFLPRNFPFSLEREINCELKK